MSFLTNAEILSIFGELSKVPRGYESFFNHVDDNVHWEITGQNALSGICRSKAEFLDKVWLPIIKLIAEPGPIFEIACPDSITRNDEGWVNVELKTKDTRTKLGNRLYSQHYSWHCKKKIVQVRCFFDTSLAETVLLDEKYRQQALAILPNDGRPGMGGPDYPSIPFDPAYKRFLNEFYLLMDSPNEH
ncbi:putative ketosteroid isomerase [Aspergillus tubingensis]|uniref:putative ketosteroid isomerase n=1 Tax=Aspergillus tubingensis TaxID=5068 RepID=UPI001579234D|nr:putative ketosteroid isomerase [Aspergillus tubingensis]GFN13410.1 putative ketosteroid isomerase [Aspergillus tubingensis]